MKPNKQHVAIWHGLRMVLHFDDDYRIGSNTYDIAEHCMVEPDKTLLTASYAWSGSDFYETMTFQEFVDKTLSGH